MSTRAPDAPPVRAAVALGSNLGDRAAHLARAEAAIAAFPGTVVLARTACEETAPIGPVPQGPFLNQMLLLDTTLGPRALLDALLALEAEAGRVRSVRWGPRTLDCDIVLYGDTPITEPGLTIPHPEWVHRDFWRRELAELGVPLPAG